MARRHSSARNSGYGGRERHRSRQRHRRRHTRNSRQPLPVGASTRRKAASFAGTTTASISAAEPRQPTVSPTSSAIDRSHASRWSGIAMTAASPFAPSTTSISRIGSCAMGLRSIGHDTARTHMPKHSGKPNRTSAGFGRAASRCHGSFAPAFARAGVRANARMSRRNTPRLA